MTDDTISRAVAIDALNRRWGTCILGDDIAEGCAKVLTALPPAQQWISCTSETMPVTTDTYLVKVSIYDGERVHMGVRTADWNVRFKTWTVHETPIHMIGEVIEWMPIPLEGE